MYCENHRDKVEAVALTKTGKRFGCPFDVSITDDVIELSDNYEPGIGCGIYAVHPCTCPAEWCCHPDGHAQLVGYCSTCVRRDWVWKIGMALKDAWTDHGSPDVALDWQPPMRFEVKDEILQATPIVIEGEPALQVSVPTTAD